MEGVNVSEALRSKHIRTLELLQKTLDDKSRLAAQVQQLQKVSGGYKKSAKPVSNNIVIGTKTT